MTDEKVIKLFAGDVDISSYISNLSWQNSIDELATKMSFDVAKSDTKYVNTYLPQPGDIVRLYTDTEIFRGIVISVDDGSEYINKYTATDFGWYLNKSAETYQFNKMTAKKAITKICNDYGIPIDKIPKLDIEITKLYLDKALSDIIKDILEICGGGYNLDVSPRGVRIYKIGDIYANPQFKITPNTHKVDSAFLRGNVSHSVSIEDMKNSIKVVSEKDNVYSLLATKKDDTSISKYGLLQKVVKIDPQKENASTVANTQLASLNQKKESFSCEIIEDINSYTRAGMLISVDGENYLIEGSDHSIKNGIHYVKLELEKFS